MTKVVNEFAKFLNCTLTTKCEPKGCTFEGLVDPLVYKQWQVKFHEIEFNCPQHGQTRLFGYRLI